MARRRQRGSQEERPDKVYSFRLDSRKPDEEAARAVLDKWIDRHGGLRELMLDVASKEEPGIKSVRREIQQAMQELRGQLFQDMLKFMRENNLQALRDYVSDEAVEAGAELDLEDSFMNAMLERFDG